MKGVWHWLYVVYGEYDCCVVDPDKPSLSLTAINVNDWVDPQTGRFLNLRDRPWLPKVDPPPILAKRTVDIADRSLIQEMHRIAVGQVQRLRDANGHLARWLQENCTMQDALAAHESTLSEGSFGHWILAHPLSPQT